MTWSHQSFPSGTRRVVKAAEAGVTGPWLYVNGARGVATRCTLCDELAALMNGGHRPAWLADMARVSETRIEALDGTMIEAVGPMVDRDPPHLNWVMADSRAAQDARARLIDRVMGIGTRVMPR